ncbi:MAG: VWA domain-containing protein [Pyrinomonadaceae bacterium]|nr:VWA domain-containing protein [Pyrinomonadaceae bacterium]MBA3568767.1 VWA domain-containing protein [Pyrinomonadaceae bacterium]MDQ3172313.1 VWA domain-containing protein [Acidobacteriota bacterium]
MKYFKSSRQLFAVTLVAALLLGTFAELAFTQSRRQPPAANQKKNKRPGETAKPGEKQEEPLPPDLIGKPQDADKVTISTQIVNVDTVVYHKKSGQIVTGLKKENFALFSDGNPQVITNFSTPEAPITVVMVLEYSKWSELFGYYGSGGFDPGTYEVLRPTAMFLSQFIKPPNDYVSVVAYDMRPTPLTDFTNDPRRINEVINLLLRNSPAFRESNLFDALKFVLIGGRGDSVVLEDSKTEKSDYAGLVTVQGRRRALILVASGIDTFSKINYGDARKITQNAGIPIYIIGTGNLFNKRYGDSLPATDSLTGMPGRLTLLQADNTLKTFAKETGGAYFPYTFEGEIPGILNSINGLLRSQYSLAFNPGDVRDGKQHKIKVSVDVNGDGVYDDKEYVIQARSVYNAPKG